MLVDGLSVGQIYGTSKASLWRNLSIGTLQKIFRTILYFFQHSRFKEFNRHWILIQTLEFLPRLPTRQDSDENCDKVYSKKNNSCFCIPGLQENSDILRLPLF